MKTIKLNFLVVLLLISVQMLVSQQLFVGDGAEFFLKKDLDFTTSNTIVTLGGSGIFSIEAGTNWGSLTEYVNGGVLGYGNGTTKLATGNNGIYAPVIAEHIGNIFAEYFNSTPNSGSNGTNVNAVSDIEYWELTGSAIITLPWNSNSDITNLVNSNGGKLSSVAIVGYNGGTWDLVSAPLTNTVTGDLSNGTVTSDATTPVNLNGFEQFTFGIDNQAVLGTDDLFITNGITILSNPVGMSEDIRFTFQNDLNGLKARLYDVNGRLIKTYNEIITSNRSGSLQRPTNSGGIYFLKFIHEGKQGIKKIILE